MPLYMGISWFRATINNDGNILYFSVNYKRPVLVMGRPIVYLAGHAIIAFYGRKFLVICLPP